MANPASSKWRIFEALRVEITRADHSPTVRELAALVELAGSTVHYYLKLLKQEGWIDWPTGKARSLSIRRLPTSPGLSTAVPLVRSAARPDGEHSKVNRTPIDLSEFAPEFAVAAGPPVGVQLIEDALAQSGVQLVDGDLFKHRVQGDSMRDAGIHDGDTLLVRRQTNAREGDIVVATIPDEATGEPRATVKRLPRSGRIRLLPANPAYAPYDSDGITIVGKVIGLWRAPV